MTDPHFFDKKFSSIFNFNFFIDSERTFSMPPFGPRLQYMLSERYWRLVEVSKGRFVFFSIICSSQQTFISFDFI